MPRTDTDQVELIVTFSNSDIAEAMIADASAWVDANLLNSGLSESVLTAIEKYLAAHMIVVAQENAEGQVSSSGLGGGALSDDYVARQNNITSYLRLASSYDTTGKIALQFMRSADQQVNVMFKRAELFTEERNSGHYLP